MNKHNLNKFKFVKINLEKMYNYILRVIDVCYHDEDLTSHEVLEIAYLRLLNDNIKHYIDKYK